MKKAYNGNIFYNCTECDRLIKVKDFQNLKNTPKEWHEKGRISSLFSM